MEIKVGDIFENVSCDYSFDPSTVEVVNADTLKCKLIKVSKDYKDEEDSPCRKEWHYTEGALLRGHKVEIREGDIFENVSRGYSFDPSTVQIIKHIESGIYECKLIKTNSDDTSPFRRTWHYDDRDLLEANKQKKEEKMRFHDEVLEEGTLAVITDTVSHFYGIGTIVVATGEVSLGYNTFEVLYPEHHYDSQLISLTEVEIVEFENTNKEILEAIEGSIKKWEGIIEGTEINEGFFNCPLCHKFHSVFVTSNRCKGCPIKQITDHYGCKGTPYSDYENVPITSNAEAELEFLEAVRKAYKNQMKEEIPEPKFKEGDFVRLKESFDNFTVHILTPDQLVRVERYESYSQEYRQHVYWMCGRSKYGTKLSQVVPEDNVEPYEFTFSNHSEETMKAIENSIHKWKDVVLGKIKEEGPLNCPLCLLFFDGGCQDCPVNEKTGLRGCERTPYTKWNDLTTNQAEGYYVDSFEAYKAALEEIEFLKNLLSKYKEELEVCRL